MGGAVRTFLAGLTGQPEDRTELRVGATKTHGGIRSDRNCEEFMKTLVIAAIAALTLTLAASAGPVMGVAPNEDCGTNGTSLNGIWENGVWQNGTQ